MGTLDGTGHPVASGSNRCPRSCRAHSLSPTDHQAAFYLALQLAISRQVSPAGPAPGARRPLPSQRGLGGTVCIRPPGAALKPLSGTLSSRIGPRVSSAGAAAVQTQGRPGPAFGDHTRNLEGSPGRVGTGQHLVTPGVAREPPSLAHRARG